MNIINYLPNLLSGLTLTIVLMLASLSIGLSLAIGMTLVSYSKVNFFKKIISAFIFFVRGTPLLVQLFLIYYGLGQFSWIRDSFVWFVLRDPTACAVITLSLNTACYTTILLQGAIQSVPRTEVLACEALGMNKWLALRRIIFPRAFRIVLPAYSNEIIMILKSTSLASTITLLDLMGVIQQMIAQTYDTLTFYMLAAAIYLMLYLIINNLLKGLQKYLSIPAH